MLSPGAPSDRATEGLYFASNAALLEPIAFVPRLRAQGSTGACGFMEAKVSESTAIFLILAKIAVKATIQQTREPIRLSQNLRQQPQRLFDCERALLVRESTSPIQQEDGESQQANNYRRLVREVVRCCASVLYDVDGIIDTGATNHISVSGDAGKETFRVRRRTCYWVPP